MLKLKRIYDAPAKDDGARILVDRLWPRGVSKLRAKLANWEKDIAPSTALREEFHHDPDKFALFTRAYSNELKKNPIAENFINETKGLLKKGNVTLLTASKDINLSNAIVLKNYIEKNL